MSTQLHDRVELQDGLYLVRGEGLNVQVPDGMSIEDLPVWRIRRACVGYADLTKTEVNWANGNSEFCHVWSLRDSYTFA